MIVKELIQALSKFKDDTEVHLQYKKDYTTLTGQDDLDMRVSVVVAKDQYELHEYPICLISVKEFED